MSSLLAIALRYTARSRIISTLNENEQKGLYKINITDNVLYFMLKGIGKLYTFIRIQLFYIFLFIE